MHERYCIGIEKEIITESFAITHMTVPGTSLRRIRELHWIKELGTTKLYSFHDQIKGVGTLSSTSRKKTSIYALFNKHPTRNDHMAKDTTRKYLLS